MDHTNEHLDIEVKAISDATQTVVERLRTQALSPNSLLFPFINKMVITAGRSLYPFVDLVAEDDARFTLGSIEMNKTTTFTIAELTNETREDSNPAIGMDVALQNALDIQMAKRIEHRIVTTLVADNTVHFTMSLNWLGIKAGINELGGNVFGVAGSIYVAVNLSRYLEIIEDPEYVNAKISLGDKLKLVVLEQLSSTQMLVMHEHGVAGGLRAKPLEKDPQPGLDRIDYIAPFTYSFGWDSKYVKFST